AALGGRSLRPLAPEPRRVAGGARVVAPPTGVCGGASRRPPPPWAACCAGGGGAGVWGLGGPPGAPRRPARPAAARRGGGVAAGGVEDAIAACNLLPGPASTQLAIFTAWRVRGTAGALVGGLAFILPGFFAILALSVLFLASSPPDWIRGAGAGAGAA